MLYHKATYDNTFWYDSWMTTPSEFGLVNGYCGKWWHGMSLAFSWGDCLNVGWCNVFSTVLVWVY